eukprot:TRINITY_DN529_c0_g1_i3.p1 TRINITY_DN529_c0_g1~~TRINITY_DN529_c0_g1_i3.p1  ORF type:complete len:229 (+),score=22.64 TRINITY_DN529_c0_g1_i3:190-876(+)
MLPTFTTDNFRCFIRKGDEEKEWWSSGSDIACHSCHFFKSDPRFSGEGSRGNCDRRVITEHSFLQCPMLTWNRSRAEQLHQKEVIKDRQKEKATARAQKKRQVESEKEAKKKKNQKTSAPKSEHFLQFCQQHGTSFDLDGPEGFAVATDQVRTFYHTQVKKERDTVVLSDPNNCFCDPPTQWEKKTSVAGKFPGRTYCVCPLRYGETGCGFFRWGQVRTMNFPNYAWN